MRTTAALTAMFAFALPAIANARHENGLRTLAQHHLADQVNWQRTRTWQLQDRLNEPRWPTRHLERQASRAYLHRLVGLWRDRHHDAKQRLRAAMSRPAHYWAWICIHSHEGSWTDSGAPFWGGLQMDYGFQQTYGAGLLARKGTADHWTPLEQMQVAEKAYTSGRGFYPWPNTARYCGLI